MPTSLDRVNTWREKFRLSLLPILLFVLLSVLAVTLTRSFKTYAYHKQQVSNAQRQLDQLSQMEAALGATEGLFRSYVLTGDHYQAQELKRQQKQFFTLKQLLEKERIVVRDISQFLDDISELGAAKFKLQNSYIAAMDGKPLRLGPDGERIRNMFQQGSPLIKSSDLIRNKLGQSHTLGESLLNRLQADLDSSYQMILLQFGLAGLFLIVLLVYAVVQSYHNIVRRAKAAGITQTLLDSTTDGFYLLDHDFRIKVMNTRAKIYLDASLACNAQLGDNMLDLLPAHYKEQARGLYLEALAGKPVKWEQHLELDGQPRVIELHHRATVEPGSANVTALSIILHDITEQYFAEQARKKSEATRRLIMNAVQDAVICIDKQGKITYWNDKAHLIFGWSEQEAVGQRLNETVIPHHHRQGHDNGFGRYQRTGEHKVLNQLLQLTAINKAGKEFPIEMYILDLKDDNEEFICAFIRDISARKASEDERNQLIERLRLTNSMVQLGTWQLNLETNKLVCDEVVYDVLEQPLSHQFTRDNWLELIHPDDRKQVSRSLAGFVEQDPEVEMYFRIYTPSGNIKYLYHKAVKFKNAEGHTIEVIGGVIDITNLKKAEATFRQVVNASPNALLLVDEDGRIKLTNRQAATMFGYTETELAELTIEQLVPERFKKEHIHIRNRYLNNPQARAIVNSRELIAQRRDGSEFPIELGLNPMELEGKAMVLASVVDITERKAAEAERLELLTRFELAANSAGMGIWEMELESGKMVWNDNMYDLVAVRRGTDMSFEHWRSLVHPEDEFNISADFDMAIQGGLSHFEQEYRVIMPDGQAKTLLQKAITFKDDTGKVTRCLGTSLDVTEQRQAAAVREELLTRFELAAETLHLGILDADLRTGNVQGDTQLKLMLGIEAIAHPDWRTWVRQVHPEDRQHMQELLLQALPQGQLLQAEWRQQRSDGDIRHFETKARIIWKAGQPSRLIAATIDVTDTVQQRNELIAAKIRAERSEQLQEQFLANMSHEIRTPLNGIVGMADLMGSTKLTEHQREYLEVIQNSSHGLLTIINDVLDLSKIKAGKFNIEKAPFNLHHVILAAFELLQLKATQKELAYHLEVDPDVPVMVKGDAGRLSQVLINLLGNAVKFTREGSVLLTVHAAGMRDGKMRMLFTVTDTGIGISDEAQSQIFNSFVQANRDVGVEFGGTGLGLAISRQLIEMQGGSIELESTVGMGSSFRVLLSFEVADEQPQEALAHNDLELITRYAGKQVLVAEDNEVNRMVIGEYLNKMGVVPTIVHNGKLAVDALKSGASFDLVILDLRMPVMDGFETARVIRDELRMELPIMALTASALRSERTRCLDIGMNAYLSKPFKAAELYHTVFTLLGGEAKAVATSSGEPAEKTTTALFDLTELRQLGEPAFAIQIIDTFVENGTATLSEMTAALDNGQMTTVFELAHRMKSSSGMLGAASLLELLRQTEAEARQETADVAVVRNLVVQATEQFVAVAAALEAAKTEVEAWT